MSVRVVISSPNDRFQSIVADHLQGIRQSITYATNALKKLDPDSVHALREDLSNLHAASVGLLEEIHKKSGDKTPVVELFPYMTTDGRVLPPISSSQPYPAA